MMSSVMIYYLVGIGEHAKEKNQIEVQFVQILAFK